MDWATTAAVVGSVISLVAGWVGLRLKLRKASDEDLKTFEQFEKRVESLEHKIIVLESKYPDQIDTLKAEMREIKDKLDKLTDVLFQFLQNQKVN